MTKEEKLLAKELFIKSYKPDQYLTERTEQYTVGTIKNAIQVAKLFFKHLDESQEK